VFRIILVKDLARKPSELDYSSYWTLKSINPVWK